MGRLTARALPGAPAAPLAWDDAPCPLCGRDRPELLLEAPDPNPGAGGPALRFPVVRCGHCRLAYTNPRPAEASIGRFYPAHYLPHRAPRKARPAPRGRRVAWHGRGRLLDFGCGGGAFLRQMAGDGWSVTGLDSSADAVERCRESGLTALQGTLPHPDLADASFDVVTLWHALEHVHRPLETLREVYRLLVPGGRVVVAVPNFGGYAAKWFGPAWFGLDLPRHLTHFAPESLQLMLTAAGFRVTDVRGTRHSDWVRSSAKLSARRGGWGLLRWKPAAKAAALAASLAGGADVVTATGERPA